MYIHENEMRVIEERVIANCPNENLSTLISDQLELPFFSLPRCRPETLPKNTYDIFVSRIKHLIPPPSTHMHR